jgi:hypothetical protein
MKGREMKKHGTNEKNTSTRRDMHMVPLLDE